MQYDCMQNLRMQYDCKQNVCNKKEDKVNTSESELLAARAEAAKIIEDAQEYAENIKFNAERQAESEYAVARETGYSDGYAEANENSKDLFDQISVIIQQLEERKVSLVEENKDFVIDLAFKIAEKVIGKKLIGDKDLFLGLYQRAVKDINAQKWVKLTVSENEAEFATSQSEYLTSLVKGADRIEITVSEKSPCGTCIVETSEKIVDASIATQMNILYSAVHESILKDESN